MAKKTNAVVPSVQTRFATQPTEQVVESVIDELEAMLVERTKQAREYTIKVFWEAGQMMRDAEKNHKVNISALVERVGQDNRIAGRQMSRTNLWMAIKIFDTYPVFEKIYNTEHGENISLTKLKKELTEPKPKKEPTIDAIAARLFDQLGMEKTKRLIKALQDILDDREG
jgi:uncharacterized pyridoxamine 5'-phosphate oxidase family protein